MAHTSGATLEPCSNITYLRKAQASGAPSDECQCCRKISIYVRRGTKWCRAKWKKPLPQLRLGISLWHRISSSTGKNMQDLAETFRNPLARIGVFCRTFFIYHSHTTGPSQSISTILSSYSIRQVETENEQMHGPGSSGGNPPLLSPRHSSPWISSTINARYLTAAFSD